MALCFIPGEPGEVSLLKSYLTAVRRSVDSLQYRNLYMEDESGNVIDILEDGNLSCAYYVTSVAHQFDLISGIRTWVSEAVDELHRCGWHTIATPREGAILVYKERQTQSGSYHKHIGFKLDGVLAISHHDSVRRPRIHHETDLGLREIEQVLWHEALV